MTPELAALLAGSLGMILGYALATFYPPNEPPTA